MAALIGRKCHFGCWRLGLRPVSRANGAINLD